MQTFSPFRGFTRVNFHPMMQVQILVILLAIIALSTGANASTVPVPSGLTRDHGQQIHITKRLLQSFNRSLAEVPDHSQCALVHTAQDQCAWISNNCDDQDSGLLSYLELYYCRLPQAKPVAMTIIIFWLIVLFSTIGITASDYFCVNLSTISTLFGLSESVTGVTLLAFGNGSPDVFSTWAAMSTNSGSLAIGELIGAAGFIAGVVAGSMAIIRPFKVARKSFIRDLGFFIVATAFSLGFLIDGHLDLWECILMVAFYVFYVIVVIIWHWQSKKRKAKRLRESRAREHFVAPEYRDDPEDQRDDEDRVVGVSRSQTMEDEFTSLERSEANFDEDNDDDDVRDRYMAEITTNMRIARPRGISRENTKNLIRPSLVGALEFRAALSSFDRSRSQLSIPLYGRRFSDDAVTDIAQHGRLQRANSDLDPIAIPPLDAGQYSDEPMSARPRAVSTNALDDVRTPNRVPASARLQPVNFLSQRTPDLPRLLIPVEDEPSSTNDTHSNTLPTPTSPHHLSPISPIESGSLVPMAHSSASLGVPGSTEQPPRSPDQSGSVAIQSVSSSQFTPYHDDPRRGRRSRASSLSLPPPIMNNTTDTIPRGIVRYWPYRFLPAPEELFSTLFPTLCNWSQKGWTQRMLAVLTAPSVFLLNITLPVVEGTEETSDEKKSEATKTTRRDPNRTTTSNSQTPIIRTEDEHGQNQPTLEPASDSQSNPSSVPKTTGWNRWLLCTQLVFAPLFVVAIIWANVDDDHDLPTFLLTFGIALVFSIVALVAVLFTSNEKTPPRYRPIFCILGFAVSVSWISTIANEVVGILKALGIILNISEAILGLTVFAVGSSLGDLVSDITIARLGYPTMALSACFGGPMLNILLGIGLSGMYLLIQRSEKYHHKHPDRPKRHYSYHIAIDRTLVVSSIALLITLVGLAIAVPLEGWHMSRRIGWALIAIWSIATAINLGIEIGGLGKAVEFLAL